MALFRCGTGAGNGLLADGGVYANEHYNADRNASIPVVGTNIVAIVDVRGASSLSCNRSFPMLIGVASDGTATNLGSYSSGSTNVTPYDYVYGYRGQLDASSPLQFTIA